MQVKPLLPWLLVVLLLAGCSPRPNLTYQPAQQEPRRQEVIRQSLFASKDATISEENIQRLLNGRIIIPDTVRVAIFNYGIQSTNRYYNSYWNDEDYLKTQQSFIETLVVQIKEADKVQKVILVPSIMTTSSPNITELRETAVRLQADLLLVFSINSDIYYKYKLFQKNESKAFATCEAILMDTRTGIIPHSSVVTRDNLVEKADEDWSDEELRKRAENGAIILTLVETGEEVAAFLSGH